MGSRIGLKQTINQSIDQNVPYQWLITEQFSIIDLLLDFDKISENGRNIYEWNQINIQYSKLISIEHTRMKKVAWHFEDLEYLNNINIQYSEILSNVTTRGYSKLFRLELMDCRFGRSIQQIISNHFIITSHYQWTGIIINSPKCPLTELNGL